MTEKIVQAVAENLTRYFGENIVIYTDEVRQGFKEPCFFIKAAEASIKQALGKRRRLINPMDILYFPPLNKKNFNMNDMYEKLSTALNEIEIDGHKVKGRNMSMKKSGGVLTSGLNSTYENGDCVLNFFVSYDFHVIDDGEPIYMERLIIGGH